MKLAIWKYPLLEADNLVHMPPGATVRALAVQEGLPCLWVEVDPDGAGESLLRERRFVVYDFGDLIPDNRGSYVGTFQMAGGTVVRHVYERTGLAAG